MSTVQLDPASIEAIADAVAERLRQPSDGRLLTVAELADLLNVSPSVIYRRSAELGALRIGSRLRFDPERAKVALMVPAVEPGPKPQARRRRNRERILQSRPRDSG